MTKQTTWRLYKEHGLNRLKHRKKWQRYPQRYEKKLPGEQVQIDLKFLDPVAWAHRTAT